MDSGKEDLKMPYKVFVMPPIAIGPGAFQGSFDALMEAVMEMIEDEGLSPDEFGREISTRVDSGQDCPCGEPDCHAHLAIKAVKADRDRDRSVPRTGGLHAYLNANPWNGEDPEMVSLVADDEDYLLENLPDPIRSMVCAIRFDREWRKIGPKREDPFPFEWPS